MRQFLLILLCLLALPCMSFAGDTMIADAEHGVKYDAQERVITLPQDQGKWYVSIFGEKSDPQYQKLQSWFKTNDGLKSLRSQVHFNEYSPDQLRFKRYAKDMPALPFVRVQTEKGSVASEYSAQFIPISADALYNGIRTDLTTSDTTHLRRWRLFCPRPPCPGPGPGPGPGPCPCPTPPVDPPPVDPPVIVDPPVGPPVLPPDPKPASHNPTWWLCILSSLAGAGIGLAQGWKDVYAPENG